MTRRIRWHRPRRIVSPAGVSEPTTKPSFAARWRRFEPLRRRLAIGAAAGAVGGVGAALADARWIKTGISEGPSFFSVLASALGLIAPLALVIGLVVGLTSWLIHPRAEPSIPGLLARLRDISAGRPADIAAFIPLAVLGLFAWATSSAHLARAVLAEDMSPPVTGTCLTAGTLTIAGIIGIFVFALTPALRHRLAAWRSEALDLTNPTYTLGAALFVIALAVGYGVLSGTVSGEGGLLGIYGILKRDELDLRLPGVLAGLALGVYLAPPLFRSLKPYQAALISILPLLLTVRAGTWLNAHPDFALALSRTGPVSARPLELLRKLTDRDRDGASGYFGGGDCDDRSAAIGPGADDIPDNGVDEDCSGTDLSLAGALEAEPQKPTPEVVEQIQSRVPKNGNVVLITIDTLRHDLGYMGYDRKVSPNLDALAARATVFERAYSLASYTGKSIGPMMIGKYPSETHRNWGHFNYFGPDDTFVAERLQKAGVHTMSVQGHRYFSPWRDCKDKPEGCGLERGFDELDLSAAPPNMEFQTDTTITSDKLTDAAIALLKKRDDSPFFLWVHYLDPHADYLQHDGVPRFGGSARDLYDNEVAFTDQHVGRLIDHVHQAPWAARTSIIVTSDHGEGFGEKNNLFRHGFELYEALVRVPLLVEVPGAEPRRIAARRSLIDLTPTILDLMGAAPPKGADESDFISGVSLLPDVFSKDAAPATRDLLIDMPGGPYNKPRRAFIHGDLKLYISDDKNKELFDLSADPLEAKNVFRERSGEIEAAYALVKKRLREITVTGKYK